MKPLTRREFFLALLAPVVAFFVALIPPKPKKKLAAGYKGSSPYDAGFFYAPYVPLQYIRMPGGEAMKYQPSMVYKSENPYYRMVKIA